MNEAGVRLVRLYHFFATAMIIYIIFVAGCYLRLFMICMRATHYPVARKNNKWECLWTVSSIRTVIVLGVPSAKILYLNEDLLEPVLTLHVVGHQ